MNSTRHALIQNNEDISYDKIQLWIENMPQVLNRTQEMTGKEPCPIRSRGNEEVEQKRSKETKTEIPERITIERVWWDR